jgi:hypothetical protein
VTNFLDLDEDLDKYVSDVLEYYDFYKVDRRKILYDAVLGTHELSPLEVSILDSPFVQRLRGIHQTSLAFLTFPSARHSRFEHSIGVSIMADRMGTALNKHLIKHMSREEIEIGIKELRIAGILHDIGHGPFSHTSEDIIAGLPSIKKVYQKEEFKNLKPHELICYKLLNSKSFKDFFNKLLKIYNEEDISLDIISNIIIGKVKDPYKDKFKSDIISSPFDADKLDYLLRDAYFTGLKIAVDCDRIFITQLIDEREGEYRRLIGDVSGVHVLEQVLFGKMLLYPSLYHHHKCRSSECMIKGIFEYILENDIKIGELNFKKVSDFLKIDDYFFLTNNQNSRLDPELCNKLKKIKSRQLLKRALVLKNSTLDDNTQFEQLLSLEQRPERLRELANIISEQVDCEKHDIWVDLPGNPTFPEPSNYIIKVTHDEYLKLEDFFPLAQWSDSYENNKWTGYVFGPPSKQEEIGVATKKIFNEIYGLNFNHQAQYLAKYPRTKEPIALK